jgi:hypothetical protein
MRNQMSIFKILYPALQWPSNKTWKTWKNGSCHLEGKLHFRMCSAMICDTDRNSCTKDFIRNVWRLKITVSYTPVDLDFQPSVNIKNLCVNCTLATIPRNVPARAKQHRTPPTYWVSYNCATLRVDANGNIEPLDPTCGIYKDQNWIRPKPSETSNLPGRLEYCTHVYIPIPICIFESTETRAFNIEVIAWVSIASGVPVIMRTLEHMNFSNFVRINVKDGSTSCALLR